jgi:sucrose phosphorylase
LSESPSRTPPSEDREAHAARLRQLLTDLYGPDAGSALADQVLRRVAHLADGPGLAPLTAADAMLITYADSLLQIGVPPLQTLARFLRDHLGDAFTSVHVLPFFPSSSDDGFAVVDFHTVEPANGSWADVEDLARDFRVMIDLVINHCSRENLWFVDFMADRPPGRDFFITVQATDDTSSVIRPRSTPLISEIRTYRGVERVWTTFSDDQIDFDFRNPEVFWTLFDVFVRYVEHGARYIRLDAVAYLWKQLGTSCLHLPQTHDVVRAFRAVIDLCGLDTRLITETNVPHAENVTYFGNGDETHLVYQFSLAPLLLYSYVFEDADHLTRWAEHLDPPPDGATTLNFLASHDGIGLRPLEGLLPQDRVAALVARMHERGGFVTTRRRSGSGKPDDDVPYEINISLFSAFGGTLADLPAYLAAHALLLSFQGVPAIYVHSLLASENALNMVERTGRTRSINRGHWHLPELEARLADDFSPQRTVLNAFRRMLRRRAACPAFAPHAPQRVLRVGERAFCLERSAPEQTVLVVASLSSSHEQVFLGDALAPGLYHDLLSDRDVKVSPALTLNPFQVVWLDTRPVA